MADDCHISARGAGIFAACLAAYSAVFRALRQCPFAGPANDSASPLGASSQPTCRFPASADFLSPSCPGGAGSTLLGSNAHAESDEGSAHEPLEHAPRPGAAEGLAGLGDHRGIEREPRQRHHPRRSAREGPARTACPGPRGRTAEHAGEERGHLRVRRDH